MANPRKIRLDRLTANYKRDVVDACQILHNVRETRCVPRVRKTVNRLYRGEFQLRGRGTGQELSWCIRGHVRGDCARVDSVEQNPVDHAVRLSAMLPKRALLNARADELDEKNSLLPIILSALEVECQCERHEYVGERAGREPAADSNLSERLDAASL